MKNDNVNHPAHYEGKVECIDALESATIGLEGIEAVDTANAIKYLWRWKKKSGVEDLKKAVWYIQHLITTLEKTPCQHRDNNGDLNHYAKHPNCRCSSIPFTGGDDMADAFPYGLEAILEDIVQKELLSVKPIMVTVPEGADIDTFIQQITKGFEKAGITPEENPVEKERTDFEKKAISLYNAYLYKLDQLNKEMDNLTCEGIGAHFVQKMILKKGFDSVEVLDEITQKLMGK